MPVHKQKQTTFLKFIAVLEIKSETIFHVNCLLLMIHMQYQGLLLPEIQESVQFVMIGVLRVKTIAVLISKPFQTPDKKIIDTDVCYNSLHAGYVFIFLSSLSCTI